ncbi:hypothetical protein L207DRAFT_414098 [Hyaloscypha variabilis F]|uniref:Homeobox domain-containing protein n=1 Tax=Hyaloscypha variabilis (strain UAMH 11265 / GT02V1 / F) TaxID=1149755 RepID=A0A2J6SD92_HYAVF|nr:hypothetical protein L207DRAFT_414098 [Hyaloscypha variabilis F]
MQQQQLPLPTAPRTNETKPRLGKDEVDILEREFKKNPKPTTQTKRQFAEDMGVELARINNWFQNRRAKRKQEKKQEAYEAGQAQDALGQYSEPSSPDFSYNNQYFSDGHMLPVQQPSVTFALPSGPPPPVAPYNPQYSDPTTASMESLHRTLAAAQAASEHDEYRHNFVDHESLDTFGGGSLVHDSANSDRAHFPSPDEAIVHFEQYAFPSAFGNNLYNNGPQNVPELQSPQEHHTPTLFSAYPTSSEVEVSAPQAVTAFPSQLLTQFDSLPQHGNGSNSDSQSPEHSSGPTLATGFHDIAESDESSASPPAPSNPFRSPPPPMDIASRRKKVQHKPAALIADTLRSSRPSMGPRTVSHAEGFRRMDSPASSPMRRIVSAGGNRNVLSGRVYKTGVESAQRSPINLGSFPESFMEQNFHNVRLPPSLTAGSSLNSSLAPPTPMSPREREMTLVKRETSISTASPNEGSMNFVFNAGTGGFTTMEGDQNLASPPETPQAQMVMHPSANNWPTMEFSEKQWSFEVPDEPLYTPAHETFALELHMPQQPAYLASMSQPVTPAFGQFNPSFMFAHEGDSPQYTLSTQPHSEYNFPDGAHYMSPSMTKQKTFQFSHTTPADFSEK